MKFFPNSDELRQHIDYYWIISDAQDLFQQSKFIYAYPGVNPEMTIVLDGHYSYKYQGKIIQSEKSQLFSFIYNELVFNPSSLKSFIIVHFKARALSSLLPFVRNNSSELMQNSICNVEDIYGKSFHKLVNQLKQLPTNKMVEVLDDFFLQKYQTGKGGFIAEITNDLKGDNSLAAIKSRTNYSNSTLERHFKGGRGRNYYLINSFKIIILILLCSIYACSSGVTTNPSKEKATATFQQLLEEALADSYDFPIGISMSVIAPDLDIDWSGATGYDHPDKDRELTADQPFRIASITKTYVATAILKLHEQGNLSIDEPIEKYISEEHLNILRAGGYAPDSILLRHCLNHTSGLYDYAGSREGYGSYAELVKRNSQRRWTRTEQLQMAMEVGNRVGDPGELYDYSDTGYILLGEIVELMADSTLGYGLRSILNFEKLDLPSTWLEIIEPTPPDLPRVVYRDFQDLDITNFDASIDLYGGGGIVSTTHDVAKFYHAIFNQEIYDKAETLELMLEKPVYTGIAERPHYDYRQGLWAFEIYGEKGYIHNGIWGTSAIHIPAYNCSIAVNFTRGHYDRILKKTILVIKNLHEREDL